MKAVQHLPALLLLICLGIIAYTVQQHEFPTLLTLYTLAFAAYMYIIYLNEKAYHFSYLIAIAITARLILLPATPFLSDDIYRFFWDAWVHAQGFSPYSFTPNELQQQVNSKEISDVFNALNSPNYYSVYPPFLQWIFRAAFHLGASFSGFTLMYKIFILISEIISLRLIHLSLKKLRLNKHHLFIYALNPLVIIELCGNAHPEAFLVLGLSIMVYGLTRFPLAVAAGWGMAIGAKLQPLLLAPLLFFYFLKKRSYIYLPFIGGILGALLLLPIFMNFQEFQNFFQSIRLYYQNFEFNGSIYKIARWIGFQIKGYNTIQYTGPILSMIAFLAILSVSIHYYFKSKKRIIPLLWMMAFSWIIYLLFSTIVHPWYLVPLLIFAVFTKMRYVVLWSYLIILSYISYSYSPVSEPVWLPFVEYVPVLIILFLELKMKKNQNHET